jgi:hypothetical protein
MRPSWIGVSGKTLKLQDIPGNLPTYTRECCQAASLLVGNFNEHTMTLCRIHEFQNLVKTIDDFAKVNLPSLWVHGNCQHCYPRKI